MIITKTINADLWIRERTQQIHAVQGDTCTRKVTVKLFANRDPWIPEGEVSVAIRYRKPDGTGGTYDALPTGETAWKLEENAVSFVLAPQMLTVPGRVEVQLEILGDDGILASFPLWVMVEENVAAGATKSHPYFNWVHRLELKLKEKLKEAKESGAFDGPVGVTPDLRIGTVTTLEAGSAAQAIITGTAENPVLNLGLPKGADAAVDATLSAAGQAADAAAVGTALAGKAAAGYGFGENLLTRSSNLLAVWGDSFESYCAKIDTVLAGMGDYTAKLVLARGIVDYGDMYQSSDNCPAILYRGAGEGNASLITFAHGGVTHGALWRLYKSGGVWTQPEWENPKMAVGVEYRTTERYLGKPVYAKVINYGAMPAETTASIPHNIGNVERFLSCDAMFFTNGSGSVTMPRYYADNNRQIASIVGSNIEVHSAVDVSSYTCYVMVKFIKTTD